MTDSPEQVEMEEKQAASKKTASKKTASKKEDEKKSTSALALVKKDVVDVVTTRIEELIGEGALEMPTNYSPQNALAAAWLALQETEDKNGKPALEVCTQNSVANSLLDMVIQGLTPARKQCYFIVYGNKLTLSRSYFGTVSVLRRMYEGARVFTEVVYEGDEFEYAIENGRKTITSHLQQIGNIDDAKIVAAYSVIDPGEGHEPLTIILTKAQIVSAWKMGKAYASKSTTHDDFGTEMSKKTVINNATKILINSSDDAYLRRAVQRQDVLTAETEMDAVVEEHGNGEEISIDLDAEPTEAVEAEVVEEKEEVTDSKAPF